MRTAETTETPVPSDPKAETDKAIAERLAAPPEQPSPTQAEADALLEPKVEATAEPKAAPEATDTVKRDVRPGAAGAGYTTR